MGGGPSFPIDAKSWSITGRQHGTHCNLLTRTLTQPLRDTDLDTGGQWGEGKVDEALASSGDQTACIQAVEGVPGPAPPPTRDLPWPPQLSPPDHPHSQAAPSGLGRSRPRGLGGPMWELSPEGSQCSHGDLHRASQSGLPSRPLHLLLAPPNYSRNGTKARGGQANQP